MAEQQSRPSSSTASLLEAFETRLARRAEAQAHPPEISRERWEYRLAAAVLTSFALPSLRPFVPAGEVPVEMPPSVLIDDVLAAPEQDGQSRSTLKAEVRAAALKRLGSRARMKAALAANPNRGRDAFQDLFERWIDEDLTRRPDLKTEPYQRLTQSVQILTWLQGTLPDLPPKEEVGALLDRRSVYGLFEHLATAQFTGREAELEALREFVGVLPAATTKASIRRILRTWTGLPSQATLVLEGAGGVGKSALVGRFLLDHIDAEPERQFPFAYLPFDNPALRVSEPFTLIVEILRQLRLLRPRGARAGEALQAFLEDYRVQRAYLDERATGGGGRQVRTRDLAALESRLRDEFVKLLREVTAPLLPNGERSPFLLVLDTFEEAQYAGEEQLLGLFDLIRDLERTEVPFRVLVSSRPPVLPSLVERLRATRLTLSDLEEPAAIELLQRLGIEDARVARSVCRQVGRAPLNLQLAARLFKVETVGEQGLAGFAGRGVLFWRVNDEMVRGQLYWRLLGHIHDENVRKLAHPGLVLRKVTPSLIREVLAGPCGVEVKSQKEADRLFEELAREQALVMPGDDEELHYRPEIRVPMLTLLQRDRPGQVSEIHRAARDYYMEQRTVEARREALYHMLALGEPPWDVAHVLHGVTDLSGSRGMREFVRPLLSVMSELPTASQTWLAARVGAETPPEVRKQADVRQWEDQIGPKVFNLLRHSRSDAALELLSERSDRSADSALYALEAKALVLASSKKPRVEAAEAVLRRGIDSMSEGSNAGRLAELYWLLAQLRVTAGRREKADSTFACGEEVAAKVPDRLCLLQFITQRLLLRRGGGPLPREASPDQSAKDETALRARLAQVVDALDPGEMDRERSLVQTAALVLGRGYPRLFEKAIRAVGIGLVSQGAVDALAQSLGGDPQDLETRALRSDLIGSVFNGVAAIDNLLDVLFERAATRSEVLDALLQALEEQPHSLDAANLVGIEAYREPWENEFSAESA